MRGAKSPVAVPTCCRKPILQRRLRKGKGQAVEQLILEVNLRPEL